MEDFQVYIKRMNISDVPANILDSLVKKKSKEVTYRNRLLKCGLLLICTCLLFVSYFFYKTNGTGHIGINPLSFVLSDKIFLLLLLFFSSLLCFLNYYKKKFDKAEKELDKLREEVIDRGSEIWDPLEDRNKHVNILKHLKDAYDINLFHK